MTTSNTTSTTADVPFEAVRRRLIGADGSLTHAGNIGYTFGGGGIGVLARRYGMAAGGAGTRHDLPRRTQSGLHAHKRAES